MGIHKISSLVSGVLAVVLFAVFIYLGVNSYLDYRGRQLNDSSYIANGAVGEKLSSVPGFQKNRKTLLLALSTSCKYCDESIPFYEELKRINSENVNFVAVFREESFFVNNFLQKHNLQLTTLASINFGDIEVRGTPTLILIDENKKTISRWEGKLDLTQEKEVIDNIVD